MIDFSKYLIQETADLYTALTALNDVSTSGLTLFVVDEKYKLLGTVTDGDIRRALIGGAGVNEKVVNIMNAKPYYLLEGEDNVLKYREIKNKSISVVPLVDKNRTIIDICIVKNNKSILPIDAVLMAGGKGERLRPLTESCPKPLLRVGDKAIIDYNVESLIKFGVKNVHVTVNYLKEQLIAHFEEPKLGVKINVVEEPKFLGTAGGILYVDNFHNDTILLMNSDLFTNINFEDFYLHFKETNADMSVAAFPYNVSVPFGIFELEGDRVKSILEKPTYNYYANAGIYLIKREFLKFIPKDTFFNTTDLINLLISKGYKVVRFPINGTWIDIGRKDEYERVCNLVKEMNLYENI